MKINSLILVFIVFLTGCDKNNGYSLWWAYGTSNHPYQLLIGNEPFSIYGSEAYITSSSLLVDCSGAPITLGRNRTLFLTKDQIVLAYNVVDEVVDLELTIPQIAEQFGRPAQDKRNIRIRINQPSLLNKCNPSKEVGFQWSK